MCQFLGASNILGQIGNQQHSHIEKLNSIVANPHIDKERLSARMAAGAEVPVF